MRKLIRTNNTEFEQNQKEYAIIDTKYKARKPIMLSKAELEEALRNSDVGIRTDLDPDWIKQNVRKDVELLGISGTLIELKGESTHIYPSVREQTILPSEGFNGITELVIHPMIDITENVVFIDIPEGFVVNNDSILDLEPVDFTLLEDSEGAVTFPISRQLKHASIAIETYEDEPDTVDLSGVSIGVGDNSIVLIGLTNEMFDSSKLYCLYFGVEDVYGLNTPEEYDSSSFNPTTTVEKTPLKLYFKVVSSGEPIED